MGVVCVMFVEKNLMLVDHLIIDGSPCLVFGNILAKASCTIGTL